MSITREQALKYVGHVVDDSLDGRTFAEFKDEPYAEDVLARNLYRLVGWQCGFEPMFVLVYSYLDMPGDTEQFPDDEAVEIAIDYLDEIGWFSDLREPDHVL